MTSDGDLSRRGRVAGSGSAPCRSISFRLAVTERDSAEKLWALRCRGINDRLDWLDLQVPLQCHPGFRLRSRASRWQRRDIFIKGIGDDFEQLHLGKCKTKPLGFCFRGLLKRDCATDCAHMVWCLVTRRTMKSPVCLSCF